MKFERLNLNRRSMLKTITALSVGSTFGLTGCSKEENNMPMKPLKGAIDKNGNEVVPWINWSGNQFSTPNERLVPKTTDELSSMIKSTKQHIRLVGAGHSFSGLVPTNETQMSLAYFYGITNINKEKQQFDVASNTFLSGVGEQLWENGMSLENMPDINTQTFGGAIATSTHGTGMNYGSMSSTVKKITMVNGLGEEINCSKDENSEIFNAARTNIGTLGAVTNLRIQAQDKHYLKETSWMMDLEEGLAKAEQLRDEHRHFEMYALPYSDYILGITLDKIERNQLLSGTVNTGDAYDTFKTLSNVIDTLPYLRSFIINTGASTVEKEERTGRNYEVLGNIRDIRFNEMEYSIPAEHGIACLREILATIKKFDIDIIFPMEYRYVKADDIWLSPFYQRDSCAISCHNFADKDYKKYFAAIEPIFWKYDGRPHWGKIHTLSAKEQRARYPMFDQFLKIRQEMDPKNIFTNNHINKVLGLA